jgi:hypothetical protein
MAKSRFTGRWRRPGGGQHSPSTTPRLTDLVTFDTTEWTLHGAESENPVEWILPTGGIAALHGFSLVPDLQAGSLESLRRQMRASLLDSGGGLLEHDVVSCARTRAVRSVVRLREPASDEHPHPPNQYVASFLLPFADFSFVIKAMCAEGGMTGYREAIIGGRAMASGAVTWSGDRPEGWVIPSPAGTTPLDANLSEDPALDAELPDHPLSIVRAAIGGVQSTLRLDESVLSAPPFPLPAT